MKLCIARWIAICSAAVSAFAACSSEAPDAKTRHYAYKTGVLAQDTPEMLAREFDVFSKKHPEWDENKRRAEFDRIQKMSAKKYDESIAVWADRKALAKAWIKTQIEDVYSPETVSDEMAQAAIDAYAFKSGHPALLTASHLLVKPDEGSTPEDRRNALQTVRNKIVESDDYSDEALRAWGESLLHAGFRADMNPDLTFPRETMTSFMGEQLSYRNMVEPFAEAAFKLSATDRLSPVVETEFGYHIILFKNFKPGKKASLEKDRQFIVDNIVMRGRMTAVTQALDRLMNNAEILLDQSKVEAIGGLKSLNNAEQAQSI